MGSSTLPKWASEPCIMGIDEAGRGPVLGPMVYGCLYCPLSYQNTLVTLKFAEKLLPLLCWYKHHYAVNHLWYFINWSCAKLPPLLDLRGGEWSLTASYSKTLKEEKREELFENLKADTSIGWEVDVISPRELSAKMLKKEKINLNEISHNSAIGLVRRVLGMGVLLSEVFVDTVGDTEKYSTKLSELFPGIKFLVAKRADSLYPVVSGASIVAKVTRDRLLREWVLEETAENMHRNFGSGYPGDPETKAWLDHHKHLVFGFPTLVRFSWGTCAPYLKDGVEVIWESDEVSENSSNNGTSKRQVKLSKLGFTGCKRKTEDIESSGKGRSKFFQARKLELVPHFQ